MDSIAGIVSYSHCHGGFTPGDAEANEMVCVTGSVELLQLFGKIDIAKDLTIEGYLTHVGRTSMEIEINIQQENELRANSLFTMIARSAKNQNQGYDVPTLSF
jgi:acyl-coenzyme A thioesterase 9